MMDVHARQGGGAPGTREEMETDVHAMHGCGLSATMEKQ